VENLNNFLHKESWWAHASPAVALPHRGELLGMEYTGSTFYCIRSWKVFLHYFCQKTKWLCSCSRKTKEQRLLPVVPCSVQGADNVKTGATKNTKQILHDSTQLLVLRSGPPHVLNTPYLGEFWVCNIYMDTLISKNIFVWLEQLEMQQNERQTEMLHELNTYTCTISPWQIWAWCCFLLGKKVKQLIIYARISLLMAWMIHVADVPSVKNGIGLWRGVWRRENQLENNGPCRKQKLEQEPMQRCQQETNS
jgi:hypothetical protein